MGAVAGQESLQSPVRYRTNDYSVPVTYGHRQVWVGGRGPHLASATLFRIALASSPSSACTSWVRNHGVWSGGPAKPLFSSTRYPVSFAACHSVASGIPTGFGSPITMAFAGNASCWRLSSNHGTASKRLAFRSHRMLCPSGSWPCARDMKARRDVRSAMSGFFRTLFAHLVSASDSHSDTSA